MAIHSEQVGIPVDLRTHFGPQRDTLVSLLERIEPKDWQAPTVCDPWDVRDLVAHVVGDMLGRIAGLRGEFTPLAPRGDESLEQLIDRANQEWVDGVRRLGPQSLLDMLRWAGPTHDRLWISRTLDEPSIGVSWADVEPAPLWLDAARDVTEYWVHERQIRSALGDTQRGQPGLATILDVFARGLPYALTRAKLADVTRVVVATDLENVRWGLELKDEMWCLCAPDQPADAIVTFDSEFLWMRWTRQPGVERPQSALSAIELAVLNHTGIVHSHPDEWT